MNSIEVVNHSQKLLEMCKYFFPKTNNPMDNYVIIHKQTCDICLKEYVLKGILFKEYEEEDEMLSYITISNGDRIHWFEFCIIHLSDKIFSNLTNEMCTGMPQYYSKQERIDWNKQSLITMISNYHIIDYLYEEFKKLTK